MSCHNKGCSNLTNFRQGGEVNTASNLGDGEGLFERKLGVDLQFKSLVAGTGIALTSDEEEVTILATGLAAPLGNGLSINGGAVSLGGSLTTNTVLSNNSLLSARTFSIFLGQTATTGYSNILLSGGDVSGPQLTNIVKTNDGSASTTLSLDSSSSYIEYRNLIDNKRSRLRLTSTFSKFEDNRLLKGLSYEADYSANNTGVNFDPRWIPDLGYVSGGFIQNQNAGFQVANYAIQGTAHVRGVGQYDDTLTTRYRIEPSGGVVVLSSLNTAGGFYTTINNANQHIFQIQSVEHLRLDVLGNLGVGTSSPSTKLHVAGTIFADKPTPGVSLLGQGGNSNFQVFHDSSFNVNLLNTSGNILVNGGLIWNSFNSNLSSVDWTAATVFSCGDFQDTKLVIRHLNGYADIQVANTAFNAARNLVLNSVFGNVGIGVNPVNKFHVLGVSEVPSTSGSAPNGTTRIQATGFTTVLDSGINALNNTAWIQSRNSTDYSQNRELRINQNGGGVNTGAFSSTVDPTATEIPSGMSSVWKNTTNGLVKLWYNDGGVMRSTTLS